MKTDILSKLKTHLQARRYSPNTVNIYMTFMSKFLDCSTKEPQFTDEKVLAYLTQMVQTGYSASSQNQFINAIKYYREQVCGEAKKEYQLFRPRKEKALPIVLDQKSMKILLNSISNLKHKAIISLAYSGGLRVGEILALTLKDVDSQRMVIHLRQGKGKKDRQVPLSEKILELLRKYYQKYRPSHYLFEGPGGKKYSSQSINAVLRRACQKADIKKKVTAHTLRHSYATHMLEKGIDIRYVQLLLGHSHIKTTEIYTHLSTRKLNELTSPFDDL